MYLYSDILLYNMEMEVFYYDVCEIPRVEVLSGINLND